MPTSPCRNLAAHKFVPLLVVLLTIQVPSIWAAEPELLAHWPLAQDFKDATGHELHGLTSGEIRFVDLKGSSDAPSSGTAAARFERGNSGVQIADDARFALGTSPFTIAMWVAIDANDPTPCDLISKFDEKLRRGWGLSVVTNNAAPSGTPNSRQLQFFISDGASESDWVDCGRPGKAVLPYAMAVFDGNLYAGTCEPDAGRTGHVYRYAGGTEWADCGAPGDVNAISSLCEFDGQLYAGVSRYRLRGSALPDSENQNPGGRVYRYDGDSQWTLCGQLPNCEAINGMTVYRGALYVSSMYSPGVYRYAGGEKWDAIGSPDGRRVEAMTVFDGRIFGTGYDGGEVYTYDGTAWKTVGKLPETTQTYGFAVYRGRLYVSSWPTATVFRYERDGEWTDCGRPGEELESMGMAVYNGALYAGTLPLAQVYRLQNEREWALTGRLDMTPDVKYRRAWSMAMHDGKLFCGTLPSGHVFSMESGKSVGWAKEFPTGWHHVTAVRSETSLDLYLDGKTVASSSKVESQSKLLDINNDAPLLIGMGPQQRFEGLMRDVRIYRGALEAAAIEKLAVPAR